MKKWILLLPMLCISCETKNQTPLKQWPSYAEVQQLGGAATVQEGTGDALAQPAPNLTEEHLQMHETGDSNFERSFVPGPNSGHPESEGLGPVFNNTSCTGCHLVDGRGSLPRLPVGQLRAKLGSNESILLRISVEPTGPVHKSEENEFGAPLAVPGFSAQLFHRGVYGLRSEGDESGQADVYMHYDVKTVAYPDGETVSLRTPVFEIENPYDAPGEKAGPGARSRLLQPDVRVSPRAAPPVIGLGLLEAVRESDILALADPADHDNDGISGKPNWVADWVEYDGMRPKRRARPKMSLGRFGWKGSAPNIAQQSMGALANDMGVTNFLFSIESIFGTDLYQSFLKGRPTPQRVEALDEVAQSMIFYSQTVGVPARRNVNHPDVLEGARVFEQVSCTKCHTPSFVTGDHAVLPEFSNQKIYPFTDMLLHDMGDELADNRSDFDADGREWKTRPLWGIGLTEVVNPTASFLHDGRARSLEEAILFHGGEAARSRQAFMNLPKTQREALIKFLESL